MSCLYIIERCKGRKNYCLTFYFLHFFGGLDKSFSLDNAHASMALHLFNHDFIVQEALVLVLSLFGYCLLGPAMISFSAHINNRTKRRDRHRRGVDLVSFFFRLAAGYEGLVSPTGGLRVSRRLALRPWRCACVRVRRGRFCACGCGWA